MPPRTKSRAPKSAQLPQSRFANVNGVRLHYLFAGKGEPVVLLHGYAETSHMWRPLIGDLAKTRTVIAPDLRGAGRSSTSFDGTVAATIPFVDDPMFAATDDTGHLYVNLADPAEIAIIDTAKIALTKRIPLAPCIEPRGLAIDLKNRRLFSACSNSIMTITNIDGGKVVAKVPIGERVDAAAFDPESRLAFSANGAGTLTVLRQDAPDKYTVVENVPTARGARTMAIDPATTHKIYLGAQSAAQGAGNRKAKPGSAVLLVLGK
jgi:hypothetical protein